jgi:hypothetical protein
VKIPKNAGKSVDTWHQQLKVKRVRVEEVYVHADCTGSSDGSKSKSIIDIHNCLWVVVRLGKIHVQCYTGCSEPWHLYGWFYSFWSVSWHLGFSSDVIQWVGGSFSSSSQCIDHYILPVVWGAPEVWLVHVNCPIRHIYTKGTNRSGQRRHISHYYTLNPHYHNQWLWRREEWCFLPEQSL